MNILTFDIEEWHIEKKYYGARSHRYAKFSEILDRLLFELKERNQKATFFCVGRLVTDFPEVVAKIASNGHEIGCHSNCHRWVTEMNQAQFAEDTKSAISQLEELIGQKVYSYRAPAFSIGETNKWAFDVLYQNGITCDASVFPANRDFGGFSSFGYNEPTLISHNGITIKEFPIRTASILGKDIAFSGGGYFRLFPLWFIKYQISKGNYTMMYFHIADLIGERNKFMTKAEYENYFNDKGTLKRRFERYIKGNIGTSGGIDKLLALFSANEFLCLEDATRIIDWSKVPQINL